MCGKGEVNMLLLVKDHLKRNQPRAAVVLTILLSFVRLFGLH